MNFTELGNRLAKVNKDQILRDMIRFNDQELLDLNQKQLLSGYKGDGTQIGTYLPFTVEARRKKGLQTSFIDLFYEGNFQGKRRVEVRGLEWLITSDDWKKDFLEDKYGDSILELTKESKYRFMTEEGVTYITRRISSITGLKTKMA